MKIGDLNNTQVEWLARAANHAERTGENLALAFDETDNSLKWKVGNGPWSPPVRTEER